MKTETPSRARPERAPRSKITRKKQETSSGAALEAARHWKPRAPFAPLTMRDIELLAPELIRYAQTGAVEMRKQFAEIAQMSAQGAQRLAEAHGDALAALARASEEMILNAPVIRATIAGAIAACKPMVLPTINRKEKRI